MRLVNPQGDKEWFIPVWLVLEPFHDLTSVFSVLMLLICQSASSITGRRLRIETYQDLFSQFPPSFAIGRLFHGSMFGLELLSSSGDDR